MSEPIVLEGIHCTISIHRAAPGVVLVTFTGQDTGELGDAPFRELGRDLAGPARIELFIDARNGRTASISVSGEWALWLSKNRARFRHVSMLTGSRFIQMSAEFVRRFADLGELMRIYTDPAAFEGALGNSVAGAV
jgi:hypothetical protein